jgi:hypothetical protein
VDTRPEKGVAHDPTEPSVSLFPSFLAELSKEASVQRTCYINTIKAVCARRKVMAIRMFVMGYMLFLILVGLLEVVFHGLILSSWYCVVIAAIAFGFFIATIAAGDAGMRVGRLFMNWWILSTYFFLVSVLYRISPQIVIGSWATMLIFVALMAVIATIFRPWGY